jgi:hypothetical protein
MEIFGQLERAVRLGVSFLVIAIFAYVLLGRLWFRWKRRRYWSASCVGNALQELQSVARPPIEQQMLAKFRQDKDEDDSGGPDDPAAYARRLRAAVDEPQEVRQDRQP